MRSCAAWTVWRSHSGAPYRRNRQLCVTTSNQFRDLLFHSWRETSCDCAAATMQWQHGNSAQTVAVTIGDKRRRSSLGCRHVGAVEHGAATVAISGLTIHQRLTNCSGALTYTVSKTSGGTFGSSVDLDCWDIGTDDCCISLRRMPLGTRALSLVRTSQLPMRPASQPPARTSRWTWMPVVLTR